MDNVFNEFEFFVFGEQTVEQALSKHSVEVKIPMNELTSKEKGDLFEYYVVSLLPKNYKIEHWRSDKIFDGRWAVSNSYPDLELNRYQDCKHEGSPFTFSIECKYRSSFSKSGEITLGEEYQIRNYKKYAQKKKQKVFIALGTDGKPNEPNEVYLIPLNVIEQNTISRNDIRQFKRERVDRKLFLNLKNYTLN